MKTWREPHDDPLVYMIMVHLLIWFRFHLTPLKYNHLFTFIPVFIISMRLYGIDVHITHPTADQLVQALAPSTPTRLKFITEDSRLSSRHCMHRCNNMSLQSPNPVKYRSTPV